MRRADDRVLEACVLEQLERLGERAGGDRHVVAALAGAGATSGRKNGTCGEFVTSIQTRISSPPAARAAVDSAVEPLVRGTARRSSTSRPPTRSIMSSRVSAATARWTERLRGQAVASPVRLRIEAAAGLLVEGEQHQPLVRGGVLPDAREVVVLGAEDVGERRLDVRLRAPHGRAAPPPR